MKIVKIEQSGNNFLFTTAEDLKAGEDVLVNTRYGKQLGTVAEDSIDVDPAVLNYIVTCYDKAGLKEVLGRISYEVFKSEEKIDG